MSKIQRIILPRNWLFGRLSYINNNLKNIGRKNILNFTAEEMQLLMEASNNISKVIRAKKESSELLKKLSKI